MNIFKKSFLAVALLAAAPLTYAAPGDSVLNKITDTTKQFQAITLAKANPTLAARIAAKYVSMHEADAGTFTVALDKALDKVKLAPSFLDILTAVVNKVPSRAADIAGVVSSQYKSHVDHIAGILTNAAPDQAVQIAAATTDANGGLADKIADEIAAQIKGGLALDVATQIIASSKGSVPKADIIKSVANHFPLQTADITNAVQNKPATTPLDDKIIAFIDSLKLNKVKKGELVGVITSRKGSVSPS